MDDEICLGLSEDFLGNSCLGFQGVSACISVLHFSSGTEISLDLSEK